MRTAIALIVLLFAAPVWAKTEGYIDCGSFIEVEAGLAKHNLPKYSDITDELRMSLGTDEKLNISTFEVSSELKGRAFNEGVYVFPCGIIWDEQKWDAYWPKWKAYVRERKRDTVESSRKREKYMDCMYSHRKEMNQQNRQFIQHKCRKDAGY